MTQLAAAAALTLFAGLASAEVVHLTCAGKSANGKPSSLEVSFSPDQGWVYDGVVRVKDGVSAFVLRGLMFTIDRKTGEYLVPGTAGEPPIKGTCQKVEVKF